MEQYNYITIVEENVNMFDQLMLTDITSVLEWFYKVLNMNKIFEDEELSNHIYTSLERNGYKPITNPIEELECFNRLIKRTEEMDGNRIGFTLISLLMNNLKEHKPVSKPLRQFIEIYNETYNKEKTYSMMMDKLNKNINATVNYVIIQNGELKLLNGVLEAVDEYKSVTINGDTYPFIGYNVGISLIENVEGILLYNNSKLSLGDDLTNVSTIKRKNEELFGNKYEEAQMKIY